MLSRRAFRCYLAGVVSMAVCAILVVAWSTASAETLENEVCAYIVTDTYAPATCQNCACGCTPPTCDPPAQSGSKLFGGMNRCVDFPSEFCESQRIVQECATRFGYKLPNCFFNPLNEICAEMPWDTDINCFSGP